MDKFQLLEQKVKQLTDTVERLRTRRITQQDILPMCVKQRHTEAWMVFSGLEASLPSGTTEVKAYFAVDTDKLYLYGNSGWVSTTLS